MPIGFRCGCGKQLQVRDDLAGKKARCPGCGTILAIPSPQESARTTRQRPQADLPRATPKRPGHPTRDVEESEETSTVGLGDTSHSDDDQPRRRFKKKKKRSASSILFFPLITLFGVNFTLMKLIVAAVVLCVAGLGAFLYLSAPDAKVKVVDVYDIDQDITEFTEHGLMFTDVLVHFVHHKHPPKSLVIRENSEGTFLLIKFKLSERDVKKLAGEKYENLLLTKKDVLLQAGEEVVHPLFVYTPDVNTPSVTFRNKNPLEPDKDDDQPEKQDKREAPPPLIEARKKLVAPNEETPWTHEGVLQIDPAGKSTFKGIRGMIVTFDHGPLPSKEIKITWNQKSDFYYGARDEHVPGELWLYDWRIACLFPRPASTKGLKLTVLGKPLKMDYP
jgi:hypothetical protein